MIIIIIIKLEENNDDKEEKPEDNNIIPIKKESKPFSYYFSCAKSKPPSDDIDEPVEKEVEIGYYNLFDIITQ